MKKMQPMTQFDGIRKKQPLTCIKENYIIVVGKMTHKKRLEQPHDIEISAANFEDGKASRMFDCC